MSCRYQSRLSGKMLFQIQIVKNTISVALQKEVSSNFKLDDIQNLSQNWYIFYDYDKKYLGIINYQPALKPNSKFMISDEQRIKT